jgi:hypothetical protein
MCPPAPPRPTLLPNSIPPPPTFPPPPPAQVVVALRWPTGATFVVDSGAKPFHSSSATAPSSTSSHARKLLARYAGLAPALALRVFPLFAPLGTVQRAAGAQGARFSWAVDPAAFPAVPASTALAGGRTRCVGPCL